MIATQLLAALALSKLVSSAPLPRIITRIQTAEAVTVTNDYTTGTTTVTVPPVEIFISNGVTYTFTLTDQTAVAPTTTTVVYNDDVSIADINTDNTAATTAQVVTTSSPAPATTVPTTTTTTSAAPAAAPATTSTQAATTSATTEQVTTQQITTSTSATPVPTDDDNTTASVITIANTYTTVIQETSQETAQETEPTSTTPTSTAQETEPTTTLYTTQSSSTSSTSSYTSSIPDSTDSAVSSIIPTAIVYSPYTDDGGCKTSDQVQTDLELIASKNIPSIRVYGTDCNSISIVESIAESLNLKVNQGFWISSDGVDSIDSAVSDLIDWVQNDAKNGWDVFSFLTIGNEAIFAGYATVSELTSKIASVKSQLQAAGYTGKVTTSEPPVMWETYPALCTDSAIDFVGINSHSYFDAGIAASDAGSFVLGQIAIVEGICGSLEVMVTETGYPSQGSTNGLNVPSAANQKLAIASLLQELGGDATILTTYNDYWKTPGEYGIEQYFGVIDLIS